MKQIIPFKKELLFKTKVSEITSISLENNIDSKTKDQVNGTFHINGDYKMTEASINREKFDFKIPFEIELDGTYKEDTINLDIDNFYYEIINDDSLQVNIDVYVDGKKETPPPTPTEERSKQEDFFQPVQEITPPQKVNLPDFFDTELPRKDQTADNKNNIPTPIETNNNIEIKEEKQESDITIVNEEKNIDYEVENEINSPQKQNIIALDNSEIINQSPITKQKIEEKNINLFDSNIFNIDTYVTYYVYLVKEDDTIDKIMEKFQITKEELENYNDLSVVKKGQKLIIPSHNNE